MAWGLHQDVRIIHISNWSHCHLPGILCRQIPVFGRFPICLADQSQEDFRLRKVDTWEGLSMISFYGCKKESWLEDDLLLDLSNAFPGAVTHSKGLHLPPRSQ